MPTDATNTADFLPTELCLGVIAGGRSSRWGDTGSKCLSQFDGRPMGVQVLAQTRLAVQGICIRPEQTEAWQAMELLYPLIPESRPDLPEGPLTGLHCLISSLTPDQQMIVVPCDMPLLTDQMFQPLWQSSQTDDSLAPRVLTYASGKHTAVCLVSRHHLHSLEAYLLSGQQKFIRWLTQEQAISVAWQGDQTLLDNFNRASEADAYLMAHHPESFTRLTS